MSRAATADSSKNTPHPLPPINKIQCPVSTLNKSQPINQAALVVSNGSKTTPGFIMRRQIAVCGGKNECLKKCPKNFQMSEQYWGCVDKMSKVNFSPAETLKGGSPGLSFFECPQHTIFFRLRNKKNNFQICTL